MMKRRSWQMSEEQQQQTIIVQKGLSAYLPVILPTCKEVDTDSEKCPWLHQFIQDIILIQTANEEGFRQMIKNGPQIKHALPYSIFRHLTPVNLESSNSDRSVE